MQKVRGSSPRRSTKAAHLLTLAERRGSSLMMGAMAHDRARIHPLSGSLALRGVAGA